MITVPPKLYSVLRRAIDYAISRMFMEDDERAGLRALSDDLLLHELHEPGVREGQITIKVSRHDADGSVVGYSIKIADEILHRVEEPRTYIGLRVAEAINAVNLAVGRGRII